MSSPASGFSHEIDDANRSPHSEILLADEIANRLCDP
jgi:hypothetical protein